jgi:hypothetical protein
VVVLAGCVPTPPEPTSSPEPSVTVTPPVAAPGSRIPATCDELVSADDVAAFIGEPAPLTAIGEYISSGPLAAATAGVSTCLWRGSSDVVEFRLTITADPADIAQFSENGPQGFDKPVVVTDSIGTTSVVACESVMNGSGCYFSALVGEYWLAGTTLSDQNEADASLLVDGLSSILSGVADDLASTSPMPPWTPPARSTAGPGECDWLASGDAVANAVGLPAGSTAGGPTGPPLDPISGIWKARAGAVWCSLEYEFAVGYVAGSGWGWDALPREGTTVDVDGASDATVLCVPRGDSFDCTLRALVGDSVVSVSSGGDDEAATVARLVSGTVAAIPLLPLVAA